MAYRSVRRSSRARFVRKAVNRYWADTGIISLSTVGGTAGVQGLGVETFLNNNYRAVLKGASLVTVKGYIAAVPTVAPAVGTTSLLTLGMVVIDNSVAATRLDPQSVAGQQEQWLWQENWTQPYAAAPVATSQVLEAGRHVMTKSRRVFKSNDEDILLAFSATAGNTWNIMAHFRILVSVP